MNEQMVETIKTGLEQLGWTRSAGTAIASRTYQTAVGPRDAFAYLVDWKRDGVVWITGDYWSEGRNILEPHFVSMAKSASSDSIVEHVQRFVATVDDVVADSYAARLLRFKDN